jgi:hypothetical protein
MKLASGALSLLIASADAGPATGHPLLAAMLPRPWDFAGYWAVGRLMATGNPVYAPAQVLAMQEAIGWQAPCATLVWYAPWSLPIFWFFGLLPFGLALPLWLLFQSNLGYRTPGMRCRDARMALAATTGAACTPTRSSLALAPSLLTSK